MIEEIKFTPLKSWSIAPCSNMDCKNTDIEIIGVEIKGVKVGGFIICFELSFIEKCPACNYHFYFMIGTYRHTHNHIEFMEEWEHLKNNARRLKEMNLTVQIMEKMKIIEERNK